jgi:dolichol-phosphate mannosyltransferase
LTPETLIFVPTYNERDNAERMVRELAALRLDADMLFMDDGSPDGTGDILDALAVEIPRLTVIHRAGKQGIGSAHAEAISRAYDQGYDRLITLDCDFTHKPTDIFKLLEALTGHDIATGSRYLAPDSLPDWNLLRRSLTAFGHLLTTRLLSIRYDATGALRAYDLRRIPRAVFERVESRGYGFFFESMFVLTRAGFTVGEFPIVLPARTYGSSKMTVRETLNSGSRLLRLWTKVVTRSERHSAPASESIDATLIDPQNWDSYWGDKHAAGGKLYDLIATTYRKHIIRRNLERSIFRTYPDGSHLLHAGCGSGGVDTNLHDRMTITAVDISREAISVYRANNPTAHSVRHANILQLPFEGETFDGAYNLGVLEHFDANEIERILHEFNRVMKPGAKLVLFWPHARATSVAVLKSVHWVMRDLMKKHVALHPPEVSLLRSKKWAAATLARGGFTLEEYSFGPRDFFVQAEIVARKAGKPALNA